MTTGLTLALVAAASSGMTAGIGLWRYRMRLQFLKDVYDKGAAADLKVAADAVKGPVRDVASTIGDRAHQQRKVNPPDDSVHFELTDRI